MEATTVATAGVQPGSTAKVRALSERVDRLRNLRMLDRIIANLEGGLLFAEARPRAQAVLRIHQQARDRLRAELGL